MCGCSKGGDFESCNDPDNTWSNDSQQSNQMFGTSGAAPTLVDPILKPSSSDEIVAGFEYEVINGLRAAIGYRKRWMNQIVEDMSRDDGVTYFLGNPGYGVGLDFPKATSDCDAVWLELNKRFSNHWSVRGNYTMSWLRGNYSGFIKSDILQVYPSITSDFDLLSALVNRSGYLPNDHRHRVCFWGNYEFLFGERFSLNAGASFSAVSGAPISYMGPHPDKGAYESFLLERGAAGRMPWVFDISGSLKGKLKLGARSNLGLGVKVYNIANFQAATMVDQAYTFESAIAPLEEGSTKEDLDAAIQAFADEQGNEFDDVKNLNFGNTSAYQNPRAVRISLRFEF